MRNKLIFPDAGHTNKPTWFKYSTTTENTYEWFRYNLVDKLTGVYNTYKLDGWNRIYNRYNTILGYSYNWERWNLGNRNNYKWKTYEPAESKNKMYNVALPDLISSSGSFCPTTMPTYYNTSHSAMNISLKNSFLTQIKIRNTAFPRDRIDITERVITDGVTVNLENGLGWIEVQLYNPSIQNKSRCYYLDKSANTTIRYDAATDTIKVSGVIGFANSTEDDNVILDIQSTQRTNYIPCSWYGWLGEPEYNVPYESTAPINESAPFPYDVEAVDNIIYFRFLGKIRYIEDLDAGEYTWNKYSVSYAGSIYADAPNPSKWIINNSGIPPQSLNLRFYNIDGRVLDATVPSYSSSGYFYYSGNTVTFDTMGNLSGNKISIKDGWYGVSNAGTANTCVLLLHPDNTIDENEDYAFKYNGLFFKYNGDLNYYYLIFSNRPEYSNYSTLANEFRGFTNNQTDMLIKSNYNIGSFIEEVSSASNANLYPQDGVYNGYWYKYIGKKSKEIGTYIGEVSSYDRNAYPTRDYSIEDQIWYVYDRADVEKIKGTTLIDTVGSLNQNSYPTDGRLGDYWYVYKDRTQDVYNKGSYVDTYATRDFIEDGYNETDGYYYVWQRREPIKGEYVRQTNRTIGGATQDSDFPLLDTDARYVYELERVDHSYSIGTSTSSVFSKDIDKYPNNMHDYNFWYIRNETPKENIVKDLYIEEVFADSATAFPQDGLLDSYWYEYKGYKRIPNLQFTDKDIMGGVNYNYDLTSETDFMIGLTPSAEIKYTLNLSEVEAQDYIGRQCEYWVMYEDELEWQQVGLFNIDSAEFKTHHTTTFTAYDNMILTEVDIGDLINNKINYPVSITDLYRRILTDLQLDYVLNQDLNSNLMKNNFQLKNVTARQVLGYLAQAMGAILLVNPTGRFYLKTYERNGTIDLTNDIYSEYKQNILEVEPIGAVLIQVTDDDLGVIYPTGASREDNVYRVIGNPVLFGESEAEIRRNAEVIYNNVKNITYTPMKVNIINTYGLGLGDIVYLNDKKALVMSIAQTQSGLVLSSTGNQKRDTKQTLNSELIALRGKSNELVRDLDKTMSTIRDVEAGLESKITQTAGSLSSEITQKIGENNENYVKSQIQQTASTIRTEIENSETKTNSKIEQTAESIRSEISRQGEVVSEIRQDLNGISLTYNSNNGTASITIGNITVSNLVDGQYVDRVVAGIDFNGYCRFSDLSTPGSTVICGDNITTGTISADRIQMTGSISWGDLSSSCQNTIQSFAGSSSGGGSGNVPSYIKSTYIDATTIMSPSIYGAEIAAGSGTDGYLYMSSTGMNFYTRAGSMATVEIGYTSGAYTTPHILLGRGEGGGLKRGMIKKFGRGIWIGSNNVTGSDQPSVTYEGTGIFIDFDSHQIYKHVGGSRSVL